MFQAEGARPSDWAELIGLSAILRGKLHELDPEVHDDTVPRLGAGAADVTAAEIRLGYQLDPQHKDLLTFCNGWDSFFSYTDLLATHQLGDSDLWRRGLETIHLTTSEGSSAGLPPEHELMPIAAGREVVNVFALWRNGPVSQGGRPVFWLTGDVIDNWPNVRQWLLGINQLYRDELRTADVDSD